MTTTIPQHIAIIMDGNGRWARERRLPKIKGHIEGVKTVDVITEACAKRGIKALTLYTFSMENWKRPKKEIDSLMALFKETLKARRQKIHANNVRFNVIGRIEELPQSLRDEIEKEMEMTSKNTGLILTLALNYGGRQEIFDAVRAICREEGKDGINIDSLSEEDFGRFLYTRGLPDPDLIIRTSGEMRLSNFLLWQAAYSEIYVTDVFWPDFTTRDLDKALDEYAKRERRFGG